MWFCHWFMRSCVRYPHITSLWQKTHWCNTRVPCSHHHMRSCPNFWVLFGRSGNIWMNFCFNLNQFAHERVVQLILKVMDCHTNLIPSVNNISCACALTKPKKGNCVGLCEMKSKCYEAEKGGHAFLNRIWWHGSVSTKPGGFYSFCDISEEVPEHSLSPP